MLLAIVLQLFALASAVTATLGPTHFHREHTAQRPAQDLMAGWQDLRRAHHAGDSVIRRHDHSGVARHRHDADDASVLRVGVDDRDGALDEAAAGGLPVPVLALLGGALPAPVSRSETGARWSTRGACAFVSCPPRRVDRPPIA